MSDFNPDKITVFAKTDTRGQQIPFGIKAKDRQRHMYVIGKTGMGKSTLLENMAAQDIQNGEGMAFIDPHGSAIEVLLDYIPEERLDDVVYFAPFDMDNPVAFNIMEDVGQDTRHLVVSGLMSTFKKIWEDAWSARMEYILTNALLALIEYPDTTLLSVNRMLADKVYRDKVIAHVKDPAVKAYWIDEFNNYTERFAAEALPAIQNKIGQFTGNPLIRNIIGQPKSSFDVRKMMDERKILLINLSKGLVGETNADLIGSMLITKIYLAAMSRAELSPVQMKQMPNFYFYVDEFQSFANSTFANILSEARKYHLNLIIAHQYVAQMEEQIRDAVFGNVGTTVAFRTGPFDAEVLETVFAPQFEAVDLVNLGMYQICLTLMIDGVGSPPFSATTLPPVQTPPKSHKYMAIKRSQQNYSRPRTEVEQMVNNSHSPDERLEAAAENGHGNKGGFTKPSGFQKVGTDRYFEAQKESIKAGNGNRPDKPGKKKPNNANGNNQEGPAKNNEAKKPTNGSNRTTQQPPKPRQPEKTPEDLRAILASMTAGTSAADDQNKNKESEIPLSQKSQAKQPDTTADSEPTTHKKPTSPSTNASTQNSQPGNKRIIEPAKRSNQRPENSTKKPSGDTVSVDVKKEDLKSALAALVEQSTSSSKTEIKPEKASPQTNTQNQTQAERVQPANPSEPNTQQTDTQSNLASKPAGQTPTQPEQQQSQYQASPSADTQAPTSTVSAEEVKQSDYAQIGGARQPAFAPVAGEQAPDIAKVKQMLKTSGKERPPGV